MSIPETVGDWGTVDATWVETVEGVIKGAAIEEGVAPGEGGYLGGACCCCCCCCCCCGGCCWTGGDDSGGRASAELVEGRGADGRTWGGGGPEGVEDGVGGPDNEICSLEKTTRVYVIVGLL